MTDEELAGHLDVSINALKRAYDNREERPTFWGEDVLLMSTTIRVLADEVRRLKAEYAKLGEAVRQEHHDRAQREIESDLFKLKFIGDQT
jgi:hypothetical protein